MPDKKLEEIARKYGLVNHLRDENLQWKEYPREDDMSALREARALGLEEAAIIVESYPVIHGDHYASYTAPSNDAAKLAAECRRLAEEVKRG